VGGDDLDDVGGVANALDRLRGETAHAPRMPCPANMRPSGCFRAAIPRGGQSA
jgi:hypothetical protein